MTIGFYFIQYNMYSEEIIYARMKICINNNRNYENVIDQHDDGRYKKEEEKKKKENKKHTAYLVYSPLPFV